MHVLENRIIRIYIFTIFLIVFHRSSMVIKTRHLFRNKIKGRKTGIQKTTRLILCCSVFANILDKSISKTDHWKSEGMYQQRLALFLASKAGLLSTTAYSTIALLGQLMIKTLECSACKDQQCFCSVPGELSVLVWQALAWWSICNDAKNQGAPLLEDTEQPPDVPMKSHLNHQ